jgi:hypothetical protein
MIKLSRWLSCIGSLSTLYVVFPSSSFKNQRSHLFIQAGEVSILDGVLDHPFILKMVVHFLWCSDYGVAEFITNPTEDLNSPYAVIGAITELLLMEQLPNPRSIIAHSQHQAREIFTEILSHIRGLVGVRKVIFDHYKTHTYNIGNSQKPSTGVLALVESLIPN